MGSFITRAIIMVLGYIYPAYECYKIVERKRPDPEYLRFWCQYWVIIAVVTVVERFADALISWVPLYSEAKLAFIIYLWYPQTMGTTYVYNMLLRPLVAQHELEIDRNLNELRTRAGDVVLQWWQRGSVHAQARFSELLQFLAMQSNGSQQRSFPNQGVPQGPARAPAQGHSREYPQGNSPLYPQPAAGFPIDSSYPPPEVRSHHETAPYPSSQGAQAGQELYPPIPPYSQPRRPYRSALSDGEGNFDIPEVKHRVPFSRMG